MATQLKKRELNELLKERDGLTCGICKESIDEEWKRYEEWMAWATSKEVPKPKAPYKRSRLGLSIDHIYPKSRAKRDGWSQERIWALENLQLAHMTCNTKKGHTWPEPAKQSTSPESGFSAPSVTNHMDSSTAVSHTGSMESEEKSVSPAVPNESEKAGVSTPSTKAQLLKEMEKEYNVMAKVWNSLPGVRLTYPEDKFRIKNCYCTKGEVKPVRDIDKYGQAVKYPYCSRCGYALPGVYEV